MGKTYTETLELRACHCDMKGVWRPSAILECMQETAGAHSAICDLGRGVMDSLGLAWVLSRLKVDFSRVPHVGETITIETYPTPTRHMFYPRSHIFRDADGAELGRANSLWVLIDFSTRRITNSELVQSRLPDNSDMAMATGMPATVKPVDGEVCEGVVAPRYTDLDMNMHVNNTKYLDWCCNALGMDALRERTVAAFDMNYDAEILPGAEIRTELARNGESFTFCGYAGGKRHFGVTGRLSGNI